MIGGVDLCSKITFRALAGVSVLLVIFCHWIGGQFYQDWGAFQWQGVGGVEALGSLELRDFWGAMAVAGIFFGLLFALGFSWARGLLILYFAIEATGALFSGISVSDPVTGFLHAISRQTLVALVALSFVSPASTLFSTLGPFQRSAGRRKHGEMYPSDQSLKPHGIVALGIALILIIGAISLIMWQSEVVPLEYQRDQAKRAFYTGGMFVIVLGTIGDIGLAVWCLRVKRGRSSAWGGLGLSTLLLGGMVILSLPFEEPRKMEKAIWNAHSYLQGVVEESPTIGSVKSQASEDGVDYADILQRAMQGGGAEELRGLMGMKFMGEAGDTHAAVLANLLVYLGDWKFAEALGQTTEQAQKDVIGMIEYHDPELLNETYPRTARLRHD